MKNYLQYIKEVRQFSDDETEIDVNDRGLTSLPKLPPKLERLECHSNNLTELPELPDTLRELSFYNNKITKLPKLPKSLTCIWGHTNKLTTVPELPKGLEHFSMPNNELISLPELPQSIHTIFIHNNKIIKLPKLPDNLISLNIHGNPLECLIPTKYLKLLNGRDDQNWLRDYYYPMIKTYQFQKKILDENISNLLELSKQTKLDDKIKLKFKDIVKQTEWS